MLLEQRKLLAAAPEQERIAALQAHDLVAGEGLFQQDLADAPLRHGVMVGTLSHINGPHVGGNHRQHAVADQAVVDHHVGTLEHRLALAGEQARVAGPRPHQPDLAYRIAHRTSPPPARSSSARSHASWTACAALPLTRPLRASPRSSS